MQKMNYYNYFTEIEDTFIRRRGKHLLLSPLDWALIESWRERGIPLHIVIRGIEQVFDNFEKNPRPRTIKGLMFCREEVEAQFEEWSKAQTGKATDDAAAENTLSQNDLAAHLGGLVSALQRISDTALSEYVQRAADRIEELRANIPRSAELVDKSLSDIEEMLDNALIEHTDPSELRRIENVVNNHLRPYKKTMDEASLANTKRLMMLKFLRELHGIPRLSLFYV